MFTASPYENKAGTFMGFLVMSVCFGRKAT